MRHRSTEGLDALEVCGAVMPGAVEAAAAVRDGSVSAVSLVEWCEAAIARRDREVQAFTFTDFGRARALAEQVDVAVGRGDIDSLGPLAGVPFAVKDLEDCAGMPTGFGSVLRERVEPCVTGSIHCRRLLAAGAIPIGKTAVPEFGTLSFTRSRAHGTTRNPWDLTRTPGGSSGGSAAAVAAGMVPFATASDGGGSTRIPASFCGLVGMKPSFGRIPYPNPDPSLVRVFGAETVCVADAARLLDVTAGPDDCDKTSLPLPGVGYEASIETLDVSTLRMGWSADLGFAIVEPEVHAITRAAAEALAAAAGAELVDVTVKLSDPVRALFETASLALWLDVSVEELGRRGDELTPAVRAVLLASYERTLPSLVAGFRDRLRLEEEVAVLFAEVDVLLTPTTAVAAFAADGPPPAVVAGEDLRARYGLTAGAMSVPFPMFANLTWNPACSVPAGLTSEGLPVGLQIVGRRHADEVVLRTARILELARPWPMRAPMSSQ